MSRCQAQSLNVLKTVPAAYAADTAVSASWTCSCMRQASANHTASASQTLLLLQQAMLSATGHVLGVDRQLMPCLTARLTKTHTTPSTCTTCTHSRQARQLLDMFWGWTQ